MFGLGMSEIIFLGVLALIIIGPKELPELARTLGRFINELKRSTNVLGEELKQQARIDRINFNEPFPRQQELVEEQQPQKEDASVVPEQMELSEQKPAAEEKPEDQKPS
ncbi:twin-arginine translocase TatA/TatE family subunit [Bdellovibrio sp. 22V]|uniref:Sec-independent protein translocase subunit TatA/TatB n=1 Tax=Bdellovibrio TaxID=958 RepID=UPI002542B9F9|nr:twin-arginine translocase TatA/TatE family subunit [Bdellovibrio sp. 22V]WII73062.1 twin-arginine translocase TatA/TatE family subunit [Bdellovibrio sp. 22V]